MQYYLTIKTVLLNNRALIQKLSCTCTTPIHNQTSPMNSYTPDNQIFSSITRPLNTSQELCVPHKARFSSKLSIKVQIHLQTTNLLRSIHMFLAAHMPYYEQNLPTSPNRLLLTAKPSNQIALLEEKEAS